VGDGREENLFVDRNCDDGVVGLVEKQAEILTHARTHTNQKRVVRCRARRGKRKLEEKLRYKGSGEL